MRSSAVTDPAPRTHGAADSGVPILNRLNPARAPSWLRPIIYAFLGLLAAGIAAVTAPTRLRRRLLQQLNPRASRDSAGIEAAPPVSVRTILRRLWPFARPYRRKLLLMLVLVPIPPAIQSVEVLLFKRLVDHVMVPHRFDLFPELGAAFVGLALLGGLVSFVDDYLSTLVGERFVLDLRTTLFRHVHGLSLDFFDRRRLGDLITRITGDTSAIEQVVLSGVSSALSYCLRIAFFAGLLFYLRWDLAVISLVVAPLFIVVARRFARLRRQASREVRRHTGGMNAVVEESLSNVQLVQAFNRQEAETRRFYNQSFAAFAAQMTATRLRAVYRPLVEVIELVGVLLILGFGTWELSRGWLTLGGLFAFLAVLTQLYSPVRGLGRLGNTIASANAGAERVIELLDETPSVREPQQPVALEPGPALVEFESVSFQYPSAKSKALMDASFSVRPGEMVAIVGPSGAGKSTVAKLLLRLYDPTTGTIRINGHDLRALGLESLREQTASVFQETLVFNASIAENIAYGRPDATVAEVAEAARIAGLESFVSKLPEKLDTIVGEKGRKLSGGQRQRIAIARAYLRKSPILILDEPTTGLDARSAARVLMPLRKLAEGRTTILISHDLALVKDATAIIVVDRGRIVETGTHDELISRDGVYRWLHQLPARRLTAVGE